MLLDTDDIEANAEAIAGLKGQLGGLSFKYATEEDALGSGDNEKGYYWSKDASGNWVKIGAVGSAVPSDVLVTKKFSSESGVDIEGTMPNPTSAAVSKRENPTSNLLVGTDRIAINNGTNTTEAHDTGSTLINLGVGEQLTLPHGYYNKDIVISNGDMHKGSADVILTSDNKTVTMPAGYYDEFTITGDFQDLPDVTLTYSHHIHSLESATLTKENDSMSTTSVTQTYGDGYQSTVPQGCYTTPYYHLHYVESGVRSCGGHIVNEITRHDDGAVWGRHYYCDTCGKSYGSSSPDECWYEGSRCSQTFPYTNTADYWTTDKTGHEGNVVQTVYIKSCGRSSGEVTDIHIHK